MVTLGKNNFFSLLEISETFQTDMETIRNLLEVSQVTSIQVGSIEYVMESEFLKVFGSLDNDLSNELIDNIYPVTEREIMIATIEQLRLYKRLSIKALKEILKQEMKLSDIDNEILKNRKDTKFDQKVRNLISHRDHNGLQEYCNYVKDGRMGYLELKEALQE